MRLQDLKTKLSDANIFSFEQMTKMDRKYLQFCYRSYLKSTKSK